MPIIDLKVSGQEDLSLVQQLVTEISRLTKEVLKKKVVDSLSNWHHEQLIGQAPFFEYAHGTGIHDTARCRCSI